MSNAKRTTKKRLLRPTAPPAAPVTDPEAERRALFTAAQEAAKRAGVALDSRGDAIAALERIPGAIGSIIDIAIGDNNDIDPDFTHSDIGVNVLRALVRIRSAEWALRASLGIHESCDGWEVRK